MRFLFPYMARWYSANWSRYHQLLTAVCRRGHQAFVLQPRSLNLAETNYAEVESTEQNGLVLSEVAVSPGLWQRRFPLEKLVKKGLYTLACREPVQEIVRRQHIDVLLVYNLPQHVLLQNVPCLRVFDIADDLVAMLGQEVGSLFSPVARRMAETWQEKLIASCDLVTVASETLQERFGPAATLIPNGVSLDEVAAADGGALRREFKGPIVGYLGAFEYFVDLDMVLDAAGRLPQVTFLLVGGGRDLGRIRRRACQAGLENVILPGPVPHSMGLNYVAAMDVCLIPFRRGPVADGASPLKLFEYAALQKPIISTRTTEVMRIAHDYVLFADTLAEFTQVIHQLIDSPNSYRHLRTRGYEKVREMHSWDGIAERFLLAIEQAS
jgi:glycosyltransferase involved in cell wall biosynthesis